MRLPWAKAKEAEQSISASESGAQDGGSPSTPSSEHPLSSETIDPEKQPVLADSKTEEDGVVSFPSHPAVAPLENTSRTATTSAGNEKLPTETHEEGLTRTTS